MLIKRYSVILLTLGMLGCTSSQTQSAVEGFGEGMQGSIESRNKDKSRDREDRSVQNEDVTNGVLNMFLQGVFSLFSSEKN
ncbi:hypothetical protein JQC92_16295 [Shewanella sp. 202IG2-18]|uniref:hypothetical protein n=1 Tax=Parashewanella hymeniacidonis TaxID=2807618 RepID=UPI001961A761|nr:hypothetical protein [Parashewanella hymeniacidonis]MBM7073576.1 hypothetical protein [Parashewanella hymeniacidonis]